MGGRMLTPHNLRVAQGLKKVADRLGCASSTLALAWLLHRPAPVIPIVGARNLKQLDENLACVDLSLDADTLSELNALSPPAATFPESLLAMPPMRTMVHGKAVPERLKAWDQA